MFTPYPDKNDKSIYTIPSSSHPSYNPDSRPPMAVMKGCIAEMESSISKMQKSTTDCRKHIGEMRKLIQELKEHIDNHDS